MWRKELVVGGKRERQNGDEELRGGERSPGPGTGEAENDNSNAEELWSARGRGLDMGRGISVFTQLRNVSHYTR